MPSSRGSSRLRDQNCLLRLPALAGVFFTTSATWEATLCQTMSHDLLSPDGYIVMELLLPLPCKWRELPPTQCLSPLTLSFVYEGLHPHGEGDRPEKLRDIMPGLKEEDFHF